MTRSISMADAISRNELALCSVPECGRHRKGVSVYCHGHRNRDSLYGHPLQKRLQASAHAMERHLVAEIFQSNQDHPGILSAVRWVQEWMDDAITGRSGEVLAAEDLRRLHDNGVTATDIVIESSAFYVFQ